MRTETLKWKYLLPAAIAFFAVVLYQSPSPSGSARTESSELAMPQAKSIAVPEAQALIASGAIVVDVRDRSVSADAHLPNALLIPLDVLVARMGKMEVAKTADIVVYCGDGSTLGPRAAAALNAAGYAHAVNLGSGLDGWEKAGLPVSRS
jgi:rhodanese-related sulfurtransferase